MNGYLFDTNHATPLIVPDDPVRLRFEAMPAAKFHLCPVVAGEVRYGFRDMRDQRRGRAALVAWGALTTRFVPLPIDIHDGETAVDLRLDERRRGRQLKLPDALIAAIALRHDLTLLTADRDFDRIPGLRVENWLNP